MEILDYFLESSWYFLVVDAIGGASSGRAHARTGDRYQDMKEMGLDPK